MKPESPLPPPESREENAALAGGSVTGAFATPRAAAVPSPELAWLAPAAPGLPAESPQPPTAMPTAVAPLLPQAPLVPQAPPPASAGFTQMMRALNLDQVAAPKAPAAPPSMPPVPFTTAPTFVEASASRHPLSPEETTPAGATPQVPGSFTQLFQAIPAAQPAEAATYTPLPAPQARAVSALPPAPTVEALPAPTVEALPAPPPASTPGSFTQLFQPAEFTIPASAPGPAMPIAPNPPVAPHLPVALPDPVFPVPQHGSTSPEPGGFTKMFQALNPAGPHAAATPAPPLDPAQAKPSESVQIPLAHASPPQAATGRDALDDLFAQLGPSSQPAEPTPSTPPPRSAMPPPPLAAAPGSFTQMFQTLSPPVKPVSSGEPFLASGPLPTHAPPPAPPFKASSSFPGPFGAEPVAAKPFSFDPAPRNAPFAPPPAPAQPPAGPGLTQMLHSLAHTQAPPRPAPLPVAPPPPERSLFTASYESLSAPATPPSLPPQSNVFSPPAAPAAGAGPSEFTRILNASALREAALHDNASPTASSPQAAAPPPASAASAAAPKPAEQSPETTPAAGMHKYLPLLLILVIFLLIAILVAVVVLMKH